MASHRTRLRDSRAYMFDIGLCVLGLGLLGWALASGLETEWELGVAALVGIPLVAVVARYPMVLDGEDGGIEIGFDSSILMFLLCTFDATSAIAVWGVAVILTQLISGKRPAAQVFNVGVGILAAGAAAALFHLVRGSGPGSGIGTARELLAIVIAAAVYFLVDYVLSAVSVSIDTSSQLRKQLIQRGTLLAITAFVPFDLLGYLAAVLLRESPWWTLVLLVVPLLTLLLSTRAITRGREDQRRLTVLLEAAVRVQSVHVPEQIGEALLYDARRLIRLTDVELRGSAPDPDEVGAQVKRGKDPLWVVAPARDRARSTIAADEQALGALAVLGSDAFARIQLTADMVHYARHDPLTDLPNRGILLDRVTHALHRARRSQVRVALLFLDLDSFKPVNDRYGHAAGDAVLVEVARRLLECTRASDTVARLGGDEFAVLLEDISISEAFEIADRILASLSHGIQVGTDSVTLGGSIGIAFGEGIESGETLLRHADLAMYEAKGRGKGQALAYEPAMGRERMEGLQLVEGLRRAIEADALDVVYQPVVTSRTGRIVGVEALVRWRQDGVDMPTEEFIRTAEATGLVVPLGERVLAKVARDAPALRAAAGGRISMSVNVSPRQLRDPEFLGVVARTVREMEGTGLVLEITEREGVADDLLVLEAMRKITALGVRFAVDDFGVGFSSIGYLHRVPAHVVKIDASLASDIDTDDRACSVLAGIVSMAEALSLDVVVEGIERAGQLEKVCNEVGAPLVQGYLLHRPMPLASVLSVVGANRQGRPPAAADDPPPSSTDSGEVLARA
jgi:diguanylate cyclase (GGDEF)-like protein